MLDSLKQLIENRLGLNIVLDDILISDIYYIKISPLHLRAALYFLKHDPDTRLNLLDQIIILPTHSIIWPRGLKSKASHEIFYQFKSLKLPYKVSLVLEVEPPLELLPSITPIFLGARWLEEDISHNYKIEFEASERDLG